MNSLTITKSKEVSQQIQSKQNEIDLATRILQVQTTLQDRVDRLVRQDRQFYADEQNRIRDDLLAGIRQRRGEFESDRAFDQGRYEFEVGRYQDERNFGYNVYRDQRDFGEQRYRDRRDFGESQYRDRRDFGEQAFRDRRNFGYQKYRDQREFEMRRYQDERNFEMDKYRDERNFMRDVFESNRAHLTQQQQIKFNQKIAEYDRTFQLYQQKRAEWEYEQENHPNSLKSQKLRLEIQRFQQQVKNFPIEQEMKRLGLEYDRQRLAYLYDELDYKYAALNQNERDGQQITQNQATVRAHLMNMDPNYLEQLGQQFGLPEVNLNAWWGINNDAKTRRYVDAIIQRLWLSNRGDIVDRIMQL